MSLNQKISLEVTEKLNHISEVAGRNASEALSKLTDQKLEVVIMGSEVVSIEDINDVLDADDVVTAVYLEIKGDLNGGIILAFPERSSLSLVDILLKKSDGETVSIDDMAKSVLKETGNILAGNYLAALSNYLKLNALESIPDITSDSAESIMNSLAIEISRHSFEALLFKMNFVVDKAVIKGQMIIFFDSDSAKKMIDALK